jgi:demethylmenaquinone methyltransferase/2-methoxy-6-polyprenyl-1,4-benzoquinol methylase
MVDKAPVRIREMFDRISPTYDFLNHLLSLNTDVAWRKKAAEACGRPKRALDVCCGTGDLAIAIRDRWRCAVVGSDFAYRMLEIARKKSKGRIAFHQADTMRLPFADGAFDACTVGFGIRNVSDTRRGIAEMARVVRKGGRVVILEFTLPKPGFLRKAYLAYFNHVLPRVGAMISRDRAYRYLNESVREWKTPGELETVMRSVGLRDVGHTLLSLGIAAIHTGTV